MGYIITLGLAIAVLHGCTVGPDYVRPEVDVPDRWRVDYEEAAGVINSRWWEQFGDPVLNDLIDVALRENKDVRLAAARIEEFAARLSIARSGFFPQIGYDASADRSRSSRETAAGVPPGADRVNDTFLATLNVGWELDVWGRLRRANEAARADLLAAEEGRRTVLLTLVTSVATGYVTLRGLDRQLEISRRTLQTRAGTLRLFELQFQGGVVSDLELAQIRSEYEQAAVAIPVLELQIGQLENAISVVLGRNPAPIPRGLNIDDLMSPAVPSGVPSDLLDRRPDVRQAEHTLVAANARIGVARALYFPSISLTGLFGYASEDLSNLLTGSANIWSLGGAALGPIFTAGRIEGQVRGAEAVQKQALIGYLQAVQTAFREVDDALLSGVKSREELAAQGRRVEALQNYARLAQKRYDNGYVSYLEVLDAERRLFDAELAHARTQRDVYTALVNTYKAMGGGWVIEAEKTANLVDYVETTLPAAAPAAEPTTPAR